MNDTKSENWERQAIERLATSALQEQRRARRWGIFFKSLLFLYLFALLIVYWPRDLQLGVSGEDHTALVNVTGVIAPDSYASADNVVTGLRNAFEHKSTAAVILRINSPGGSPVQAGYINDEIYRLKEKHPDIPVYAVIADICASGGYYIAAAADEIYADKGSLVGSIGVIMSSFGFVEAMDKLGVERRLITAGENKAFLDPFSPVKPEERHHVQQVLDEIHRQFINTVKKGRREVLIDSDELFEGLVWTGEKSLELGLVDGLGSSSYVAREIVGVENIVDFTPRRDIFERFTRHFGGAVGEALLNQSRVHL